MSAQSCWCVRILTYFRYIEHAEVERTNVSMPFGRAFHAILSIRASKGITYTVEDAKEDFAVYFRGETEVCENITYKPEEDFWFWNQRGCDMLDVALADWPDDYTVKTVAEAFSVNVPGLSKPLVSEPCTVGRNTVRLASRIA